MPPKSREGLRQLKSGRWQARLPRTPIGGQGASIGTFATAREASHERALAIAQVAGAAGGWAAQAPGRRRGPTVTEACRTHIDALITDGRSHKTILGYEGALKIRIASMPLGQIRLAALTVVDVTTWRDARFKGSDTKPGDSVATVKYAVALLSGSYLLAAGRIHLPPNPYVGILVAPRTRAATAARQAATARRTQVPSWRVLADILHRIPAREDRIFVCLLAWGGLRFAEAASVPRVGGLAPGHQVNVGFTISRGAADWEVWPPKTGLTRTTRVPGALWRAMRPLASVSPFSAPQPADLRRLDGSWDVMLRAHGSLARPRGGTPGPGLWTAAEWARVVWKPAMVASGHPQVMTRHLRAVAATMLVAGGATVLDVQAHLGHASPETTTKFYTVAQASVLSDKSIRKVKMTAGPDLSLGVRIDRLWAGFVAAHGNPLLASWKTL